MNKFLLFLALLVSSSLQAQKQKADSLAMLLATSKTDTARVTCMWQMASYLYSNAPDSAIRIAQRALFLARKIKYEEGESRSLGQLANGFLSMGNYPRALEFYLEKLKLEEKRNNQYNLASATMNIGIVYVYQEQYPLALYYLRRADSIIVANKLTDLQYNISLNLGDVYNRQDQNDSAYLYFSHSLETAKKLNDGDFIGISLTGLAHVHVKTREYPLALQNYYAALPYLIAANDEDMLCEATLGLAKLYKAISRRDSAVYFARYSFILARKDGFQSRQLDAANFLTVAFSEFQNKDSAFIYLQESQALGDSINGKEKIRESQVMSINEKLRQDEMVENLRKAKEERRQQLQLLLIGIFIPGLFLLTLLLSRVKLHARIIRFLGVLSLLILFEYLTLLLHPLVVDITHHTPFYELLIFVAIAALVIPTHHGIEHWLIKKLTVSKTPVDKEVINIKKQRIRLPSKRSE